MQVAGETSLNFFEVSKSADVMTSALERRDTPLSMVAVVSTHN